MKSRKFGMWLGMCAAIVGIMAGMYSSDAVHGRTFAAFLSAHYVLFGVSRTQASRDVPPNNSFKPNPLRGAA